TLTRDYLTTWDKWWNKAPKEFLNYYYLGYRSAEQHEVVILTQILADEINVGYGHLYNEAVAALDGRVPRDMEDFVTRPSDALGGELVLHLHRLEHDHRAARRDLIADRDDHLDDLARDRRADRFAASRRARSGGARQPLVQRVLDLQHHLAGADRRRDAAAPA